MYEFLLLVFATIAAVAAVAWLLGRTSRIHALFWTSEILTTNGFQYPDIPPCKPSEPWVTPPLPYRPFRWGKTYKHIMGVRSMHWQDWLQLDRDVQKIADLKKMRSRTRRERVVQTLPGFENVALEACTEIALFLSKRYPHLFNCSFNENGDITRIQSHVSGDVWDLSMSDPMLVAGLLQQDDIALMVEEPNGEYRLVAGSICLAGSWRLEDKIGKTLAEIHLSGGVPGFPGNLQGSMERFFQHLKVHKPVERHNYTFQLDDELTWSEATFGPEDTYGSKVINARDAKMQHGFDGRQMYYRTERQTLRRLPRTRCIIFTIRTYLLPLSEIAAEPGVPGRLAEAVRTWPEELKAYKGSIRRYAETMLAYLDKCHEEQVASGLSESIRESQYPF